MDFDALYLRVLKFLSFRPRSEKEVRDYLNKIIKRNLVIPDSIGDPDIDSRLRGNDRGVGDKALIDLIIHKLKEQKFLNDTEFTKMWIRSRTEFKPKGERLIRFELSQKGISKDMIDEAFQSFDYASFGTAQDKQEGSLRSDKNLAAELLEKKRKKYEGMERQERFTAAGSMLARRGFDLDDIKWAIDQVFGKMV